MTKDFFVMLYHPNCGFVPMTDDDDELARYETEQAAREAAKFSFLGSEFGGEVFQIGEGSNI